MSNHQKRLAVPDSWPVERKEATYTTKAGAGPHGEGGVPLLIVLRDVLGYVDSTKEARFALGQDSVLVNGRAVSDERRPIGMFDILTFRERGEHYRVFPDEGGRLSLTSIDADAAGSKLGKIEGKRQVPGGDTQLSLHDGQTLLVDDATAYGTNDSIVVSTARSGSDDGSPRTDEIVAHFPYEEGALVTAVRGAHAGRIGTIDEIQVTPGSSANNVRIEDVHGEADFETVEAYVVVIDENFLDGDDADDATGPEVEEEPDEDESEADEDTEAVDETEADDEADEDTEAVDETEADDEADEDTEAVDETEADDASESEAGEEPQAHDDEAEAVDEEETEAAEEASAVAEADDESAVGDASDADSDETEAEEASDAAAEGADAESDDAEAAGADAAGDDDGGDDE
jgi:small subunit ribosomal protein S4e